MPDTHGLRNPLLIATLAVVAVAVACDTPSPTGPTTVIVTNTSSTTTSTSTTTTSTSTTSTSTVATTTTIPLININRTWVAFGPVTNPNQPVSLTMLLQPTSVVASSSQNWSDKFKSFVGRLPFLGTQADPVSGVVGTWRSLAGGGGRVTGSLVGIFDAGVFNGTLTAEFPECTAERNFTATLDPQFLRLTGGATIRDCKDSPLSFTNITMLVSQAPLPTTTTATSSTTSTPLQCSYALSASSTDVPSTGGDRTVGVITGPTCVWSVQNFVPWIKVQPLSGTGPTTVILTVAENPGPPRSATVVIAGLPFIVNQGVPTTTTTTSVLTTSIPPQADLLPITIDGSFCRTTDATNTTLRVLVRNGGNETAAGPFFTRVTFDSGTSITSQDRLVPALPPNTNEEVLFAIPDACRLAASCSIQIAVDANNGVVESNESNNIVGARCDYTP